MAKKVQIFNRRRIDINDLIGYDILSMYINPIDYSINVKVFDEQPDTYHLIVDDELEYGMSGQCIEDNKNRDELLNELQHLVNDSSSLIKEEYEEFMERVKIKEEIDEYMESKKIRINDWDYTGYDCVVNRYDSNSMLFRISVSENNLIKVDYDSFRNFDKWGNSKHQVFIAIRFFKEWLDDKLAHGFEDDDDEYIYNEKFTKDELIDMLEDEDIKADSIYSTLDTQAFRYNGDLYLVKLLDYENYRHIKNESIRDNCKYDVDKCICNTIMYVHLGKYRFDEGDSELNVIENALESWSWWSSVEGYSMIEDLVNEIKGEK